MQLRLKACVLRRSLSEIGFSVPVIGAARSVNANVEKTSELKLLPRSNLLALAASGETGGLASVDYIPVITKYAMSEKRAKSIPSWQREDASASSSGTERDAEDRAAPSDSSRAPVIEKFARSPQDDGMEDAPIERKKALLKSKGLIDLGTDELVGVSRILKDPSDASEKAQENNSLVSRKMDMLYLFNVPY